MLEWNPRLNLNETDVIAIPPRNEAHFDVYDKTWGHYDARGKCLTPSTK